VSRFVAEFAGPVVAGEVALGAAKTSAPVLANWLLPLATSQVAT